MRPALLSVARAFRISLSGVSAGTSVRGLREGLGGVCACAIAWASSCESAQISTRFLGALALLAFVIASICSAIGSRIFEMNSATNQISPVSCSLVSSLEPSALSDWVKPTRAPLRVEGFFSITAITRFITDFADFSERLPQLALAHSAIFSFISVLLPVGGLTHKRIEPRLSATFYHLEKVFFGGLFVMDP